MGEVGMLRCLYLKNDTMSAGELSRIMDIGTGGVANLLNSLEKNLGYAVVDRRQGGHQGGNNCLTERGLVFLYKNIE